MIIGTLKEQADETRIAISPSSITTYQKIGIDICIESSAGIKAGFKDDDFARLGATVCNKQTLLKKADILVFINEPKPEYLDGIKPSCFIISPTQDELEQSLFHFCLNKKMTLASLNHIPRISRAQNLDTLSSQSNLAGYRAVLEGISHYNRAIPMMMTAAGMIQPAKILILGAGVAGLQAIATAKRLGARVYAFDVRATVKEQVESLGAEFIEVGNEQKDSDSGYAEETSLDYQKNNKN